MGGTRSSNDRGVRVDEGKKVNGSFSKLLFSDLRE
jgi:hypothetical protein